MPNNAQPVIIIAFAVFFCLAEVSPLNLPPVRKVNEMFNGKYTRIQLEAQSSGKLGINVG